MFALALVLVCVFAGASGQILLKIGMSKIGPISQWSKLWQWEFFLHIITNPHVLLGLALYAGSAFLWLAALSNLNVSFAYPLLSLAYVVVAIASYFILKEPLSIARWAGILLIVLGSFLITRTG